MIIGTPPLLPHLGHLNYQVLAFLLLLLLCVLVCHFRRVDVEIDAVFVNVIVIFVVDFNFTGTQQQACRLSRGLQCHCCQQTSQRWRIFKTRSLFVIDKSHIICVVLSKKQPMPQYSNN